MVSAVLENQIKKNPKFLGWNFNNTTETLTVYYSNQTVFSKKINGYHLADKDAMTHVPFDNNIFILTNNATMKKNVINRNFKFLFPSDVYINEYMISTFSNNCFLFVVEEKKHFLL